MVIVEGKIKGKARPRFNTKTCHAITPNDTVSYENWVKTCYQQQCNEYTEKPVKADIYIYYKIPKSYSKSKKEKCVNNIIRPTKKPYADNVAKIILDSLNGIAYKDDTQIVDLRVIKIFTEEKERVEFQLCEMMNLESL